MSAFFDTNVLVCLVDASEPSKQAVAVELVTSRLLDRSLVISTQVLQELFSEDLQDGMRFGGRRVVNPFALRAHEPAEPEQAHPAVRRRRRAAG